MEFEMPFNQGGCLCGALRYATSSEPLRVTYSHCKFCQRATGSAYLVEPIFHRTCFEIISGKPATYTHVSEGSGKRSLSTFARPAVQSCFWTLSDFPRYSASPVERSTTRTGSTARPGPQDTSS